MSLSYRLPLLSHVCFDDQIEHWNCLEFHPGLISVFSVL